MGTTGRFSAAVVVQRQAERGAKGWTYGDLAAAAGMTEQSVMRYLTSKRDMRLTDLGDMARALDLAPDELVSRAVARAQL